MNNVQVKIAIHQRALTEYITELAEERNNEINNNMTYQAIIDTKNNHFQLVEIGWINSHKFNYCVLMHMDINTDTGNIWVQRNRTEILIDEDLAKYDIPKKHFVLGFRPPYIREDSDFAVA